MKKYLLIAMTMLVLQASVSVCLAKKKQVLATDTLQILSAKGDSCADAFDYYHASKYYRMVYDSVPSPKTTRKLANIYRRLGLNRDCASLLRGMPADSVTYKDLRTLYFAYRNLENIDSLLFYGDSVTRINPYDSEIVVSMAAYCNAVNNSEKAESVCQRYLQGDSTNMLVRRQYGYASYLQGHYAEAFHAYKQLESEGFDNYESTFVMGVSLEKLEDLGQAYDYLLRAARHKSFKDYTTLHHLGAVCAELGFTDEGISYLNQAITLQTPDSTLMSLLHKELAQAYFNKHSYEEAAAEFEKSTLYQPENPLTYYNIAQMYGAIGNRKKERENYTIFLNKSALLKDTEDNQETIARVKAYLRKP